jgi:endonuclease YncB( thermonuclease family)
VVLVVCLTSAVTMAVEPRDEVKKPSISIPTIKSIILQKSRVRKKTTSGAAPKAAAVKITPQSISGLVRVVGGDELVFGELRVRLFGIDAPEPKQNCYLDLQSYPCGVLATAWLTRKTLGKEVTCRGNKRDRAGRLLAECAIAGHSLSLAMVRAGWALALPAQSEVYVKNQELAKLAKAGLWNGQFTPPWEWRRERHDAVPPPSQAKKSENCLIKGNVSVTRKKLFYVPGGASYKRIRIETARGERWFCTEAEALSAGWRKAAH